MRGQYTSLYYLLWHDPHTILDAYQTALSGPLAAGAYLLLRDWKSGLKWCGLMLAVVVLPFALLDAATGHWFYLKMVVYHSLSLSRLTFARLLQYAFWDEEWPLILLAVLYTLYALSRLPSALRQRTVSDLSLLAPLFVLASFLTLPTGAVVGADHNHLLLPGLAICVAVGALLAHTLQALSGASQRVAPAVVVIASVLLLMGYVVYTSTPSIVGYGPDLVRPRSVITRDG